MTRTVSPQAILRLLKALEEATWQLTVKKETDVIIECFHEGVDLVAQISREHVESTVRGYLISDILRNLESEAGPDRQLLSKVKEVITQGEMSGLCYIEDCIAKGLSDLTSGHPRFTILPNCLEYAVPGAALSHRNRVR